MNTTLYKDKNIFDIDIINQKILSAENFVLDEEIEFSDTIFNIAKDIIDKKQKIVLLAGPSSSGKTTTSYRFIDEFSRLGVSCIAISMDNFYKNRDELTVNKNGVVDYESVDILDLNLIKVKFNELVNKGQALMPLFDFPSGTRKDDFKNVVLDENSIVIVEGIHALNDRIWNLMPTTKTTKIYISVHSDFMLNGEVLLCKRDVRQLRRIVRDHYYRGTSASKTMAMWKNVCFGEEKYIIPFSKYANYRINTTFPFDICIIKKYVIPLLQDVPLDDKYYKKAQNLIKSVESFDDLDDKYLPKNSLLREFIGGGKYDYA